MLFPPFILSNPFLAIRFLDVLPNFTEALLRIDGYPEFATSVKDLKPEDQKKVKELAIKIVNSHKTNQPIVSFLVRGHADVALRTPKGNARTEFERKVSQQRADSARNVILSEIIRQPGGDLVAKKIFFTSKGFGSQFREKAPTPGRPLTEAEMRKNRRIEIFTAETIVPPKKPEPKPAPTPPPPAEKGTRWRIQIKSGSVAAIPLPGPTQTSSITINLVFEITELPAGPKATFSAVTTGFGLPSAAISIVPGASSAKTPVTEGAPVDFKTKKFTQLSSFAGAVEILQEPGAGISAASTGGNFLFDFAGLKETFGTFTEPSTVSAPAGQGALAPISVGLGAVTKGIITIQGGGAKAP